MLEFVSILIFLDSSFLQSIICVARRMSSRCCLNPYFPGFIFLILDGFVTVLRTVIQSQSLFSWIHLSYGKKGTICWSSSDFCLNPYFPGFIFLMKERQFHVGICKVIRLNPYFPGFIFLINCLCLIWTVILRTSQSLFSWIHLSYRSGTLYVA